MSGATAYNRKLTPAQCAKIETLHAAGVTQKDLAARFGVSASRVSLMLSGHTPAPQAYLRNACACGALKSPAARRCRRCYLDSRARAFNHGS